MSCWNRLRVRVPPGTRPIHAGKKILGVLIFAQIHAGPVLALARIQETILNLRRYFPEYFAKFLLEFTRREYMPRLYSHPGEYSEGREWGVGSVVVEFGVFGAPRFSVQRPQNTYFKGFWDLWTENRGAPKTPNSTTTDPTPHSRPSEIQEIFLANYLCIGSTVCILGAL